MYIYVTKIYLKQYVKNDSAQTGMPGIPFHVHCSYFILSNFMTFRTTKNVLT